MIQKYTFTGGGGGGWLDKVGLKLTQSPAKAGVEVGTELGNTSEKKLFNQRFGKRGNNSISCLDN